MLPKKSYLTLAVVLLAVSLIAAVLIFIFSRNESSEQITLNSRVVEKNSSLESQIENWSLYQEDPSVVVGGTGDCGSRAFTEFYEQINAGSKKILRLNNALELVITPNYNQLTNEQFLAYNEDDQLICVAGAIYPFRAYTDKLLWKGVCSTGAIPPENSNSYQVFAKCQEADEIVEAYFNAQSQSLNLSKVTIENSNDEQLLNLPYINASIKIPDSFFSISDSELEQLNSREYESEYYCGFVHHQTKNGNMFWINYRNDLDPNCISDTNLPTLSRLQEYLIGKSNICGTLNNEDIYSDCIDIDVPSTSVNEAVAFHQFIPDYSDSDGEIGTVARVYFFTNHDSGMNNIILIALIPEKVSIKKNEFKAFTKKMYDSTDPEIIKFTEEIANYLNAVSSNIVFK
ncbi:MAG: hypothetical protein PHH01_02075 [Patescibacteria group bacterium]|nr:hypothetical protein [Patescibacteria group bacterium]